MYPEKHKIEISEFQLQPYDFIIVAVMERDDISISLFQMVNVKLMKMKNKY